MPDAQPIGLLREALSSGRLTINELDDGSGVVLDIDGERILTMNATGLFIMQSIADGAPDEQTIIDSMVEHFEVERDQARQDLPGFLKRVESSLHG